MNVGHPEGQDGLEKVLTRDDGGGLRPRRARPDRGHQHDPRRERRPALGEPAAGGDPVAPAGTPEDRARRGGADRAAAAGRHGVHRRPRARWSGSSTSRSWTTPRAATEAAPHGATRTTSAWWRPRLADRQRHVAGAHRDGAPPHHGRCVERLLARVREQLERDHRPAGSGKRAGETAQRQLPPRRAARPDRPRSWRASSTCAPPVTVRRLASTATAAESELPGTRPSCALGVGAVGPPGAARPALGREQTLERAVQAVVGPREVEPARSRRRIGPARLHVLEEAEDLTGPILVGGADRLVHLHPAQRRGRGSAAPARAPLAGRSRAPVIGSSAARLAWKERKLTRHPRARQ